jgi:hypothetical protein
LFRFPSQTSQPAKNGLRLSSAPTHTTTTGFLPVFHLGLSGFTEMTHLAGDGHEYDVRSGLLKPSLIKPILTTIEKTLVLKKMGSLSASDRHTLREILHQIIG